MQDSLSRRERQIMDIVYRRGEASAQEILDDIADPPSYSTIRALLRVLVEKQHLQHREDGPRYVYAPTLSRQKARAGALAQVELSQDELDELSALIDAARRKGR